MSDSTSLIYQLALTQFNLPAKINEAFDAASAAMVYGKQANTSTGLVWGYYGGRFGGFAIANGTLTLTASTTLYIVAARATGVVSFSAALTNWDDQGNFMRLYSVVTGATTLTSWQDHRFGPGGSHGLKIAEAIVSDSTARAIVLADAGRILLHPSADITARTWTIPANAAVPFPVGTSFRFINQSAAGILSIAITTDTMRHANTANVGTRTLAANNMAEAIKLTATEWIISGTAGLT